MTRFAGVLLLFAFARPQDDPSARVKELVEQLGSDEVQAADDASAELVKLGGPALDAIRRHLASSSGDTKLRLEQAVKQIERNLRRDRAMGKPVLVSLKPGARPLKEVLDELKAASGQPLVFQDLPEGAVDGKVDKLPFWEALDSVCRLHGGVMWRVREAEIRIEKRPYRALPRVVHGNLVVWLDRLRVNHYFQRGGASTSVSIEGTAAWVKGGKPQSATLSFDALEDDKGTNLLAQQGNVWYGASTDGDDGKERLSTPLHFWQQQPPEDEAKALSKCKGSVKVTFVLEKKKVLTIANPGGAKGTSHSAEGLSVTVLDLKREGGTVAVSVQVTARTKDGEAMPVSAADFTLTDKEGKSHGAQGRAESWSSSYDQEGMSSVVQYGLTVKIPEKAEIASLDLAAAVDVEEVVIPFDFKDLPLR